ncbi:MAG: chromosome segregation protein SMC [Cenarchaeum sp. SB0672_bin_9]|nr:chromosome segregation protein SMC [Cenarchaeum sp. SB0672_bin_9]
MVHMDKVELYGFKSFGFKNTTLKLSPGLVSISGPNGSGKSSILDAIVFALGEKSPRILRVPSLKSVVNDQEGSRKSTKVARASVHLDNADRKIPVNSDKVVVTRMINNEGESAYYLNKQKTTRSHIRDILDAAKASPNVFNHVQQGYIQRISELSPDERQKTIEDMVGLSYFDEKKRAAESELERADRGLEVALAKMNEVKNNILDMEEERNQVIRSNILNQELKYYSTIQSLRRLQSLQSKIDSATQRYDTLSDDIDKTSLTQSEVQEEINSLVEKRKTFLDNDNTYGKDKAHIANEVNVAVQNVQDLTVELKTTKSDLEINKRHLRETRQNILEIVSTRRDLRQKMHATHETMNLMYRQNTTITDTLNGVDEKRANVLSWQSEAASKKARSEGVLKLYRATLNTHERHLYHIDTSIKDDIDRAQSDYMRLDQLEQVISDMVSTRDRLKLWIDKNDSRIKHTHDRLEELDKVRHSLKKNISDIDTLTILSDQVTSRYDSKLRLARRVMHEDYSVGRLRVDAPELGVLGLAYELLSWDTTHERAIMAVGADWLKALVVEDVDTMLSVASIIRQMKLPRVRILPISALPNTQSTLDYALSGYIRCEDRFTPLKNFLFGHVTLCSSLQAARRVAQGRGHAVTLNGEYVGLGDSVILDGGSVVANLSKMISVSSDIEGLQRYIKQLKRLSEVYSHRLADTEKKIHRYNSKLSQMRQAKAAEDQNLENLESHISNTHKVIDDISCRLQKYNSDMPGKKTQSERLQALVYRVRELIATEEDQIPTDTTQKIAVKLELLNRQKTEFESLKADADTKLSNIKAEWQSLQSRSRTLISGGISLSRRQITLIQEGERLEESLEPLQEKLSKKQGTVELLREKEQNIIKMSSDFTKHIRECDDALEPLRAQHGNLTNDIAGLRRKQDSLKRDISDYRARHLRITDTLPPHTRDIPVDVDPEPFMDKIRAELEGMPPLNANAPASYARVSSGYRSMSERKNELEMDRNGIVAFIEGVEKDKRQTYLDAFDVVDTEIRSIFDKMSGGSAWLELEDEDDIFGSGIRYMVQFPDKQKRVSTSLSGGEKTLAAIVFVLALQRLKPSPFYLFDEADAHLDATNAERLANILSERAQDSQFIMVSLKEFVVKKADLIYGVYPKKGISQVVSYRDSRTSAVSP